MLSQCNTVSASNEVSLFVHSSFFVADINLKLPNELNEPNAQELLPGENGHETVNEPSHNWQKEKENQSPLVQENSSNDVNAGEPIIDYTFEAIIKADEDKIIPGLGDGGEPITNVSFIDKQELQKTMKKEAFNKLLSDRISLTRKIPDARHSLWGEIDYFL